MGTDYKHLATSREGFVQQIAVGYVRNGYWFFVKGKVPEGKDPEEIDRKLMDQYDVAMNAGKRHRRKQKGLANLQYIRFGQDFVMLATKGEHQWFREERNNIRDIRRVPLNICGYSVKLTPGGNVLNRKKTPGVVGPERDTKLRVRVQISRPAFLGLRADLLAHARNRSTDWYRMRLYHAGFEPYAPVRKQLLELLRQVNKARMPHGLEKIKPDCIRYHRRPVKPFSRLSTN